jgi:hypothetical protein
MTLYISEYERLATISGNALPIGDEPCLATQTIAIGEESAMSAPFHARTRFVQLHATADCALRFGATPVAAVEDTHMAAGTQMRGVQAGQRVAVIATPVGEQMGTDSLQGFFQIIADPQKAKAEYDRLNALKAAAEQAVSAAAERERAVTVKETTLADRERVIADAETKVRADQQAIAKARSEHNVRVENFTAAQREWERAKQEQEQELTAQRTALDALEKSLAHLRDREAAVQTREDKLAAGEKDYEERLTALASIATRRRA